MIIIVDGTPEIDEASFRAILDASPAFDNGTELSQKFNNDKNNGADPPHQILLP